MHKYDNHLAVVRDCCRVHPSSRPRHNALPENFAVLVRANLAVSPAAHTHTMIGFFFSSISLDNPSCPKQLVPTPNMRVGAAGAAVVVGAAGAAGASSALATLFLPFRPLAAALGFGRGSSTAGSVAAGSAAMGSAAAGSAGLWSATTLSSTAVFGEFFTLALAFTLRAFAAGLATVSSTVSAAASAAASLLRFRGGMKTKLSDKLEMNIKSA